MKPKKLLLMFQSRNFLLLFFLLLLAVACGNRDDAATPEQQLPAETQTGANTFGCLVNGKLFYPRDGVPSVASNGTPKGASFTALGDSPNYVYRELRINNYKDGKPINFFILHFHQFSGQLGTSEWKKSNFKTGLDGVQDNYLLVRSFDYNDNTWKWYGSYENSGKTTITKYQNGIFSGTFSGKLITEDGNNVIEITDGRFDFNLFTLSTKEWP